MASPSDPADLDPDDTLPTLGEYAAARLRLARETLGRTREQLAEHARLLGLDWSHDTVLAIELGRRRLQLDEVPFVPKLWQESLGGLLQMEPDTMIRLSPLATAPAGAVLRALCDTGDEPDTSDWVLIDSPEMRAERDAALAGLREFLDKDGPGPIPIGIWPDPESDAGRIMGGEEALLATPLHVIDRIQVGMREEATGKAARRLGVDREVVAAASIRRWGNTLTFERDRRVDEQAGPETSARALQALRGHATRALDLELVEVLDEFEIEHWGRS